MEARVTQGGQGQGGRWPAMVGQVGGQGLEGRGPCCLALQEEWKEPVRALCSRGEIIPGREGLEGWRTGGLEDWRVGLVLTLAWEELEHLMDPHLTPPESTGLISWVQHPYK